MDILITDEMIQKAETWQRTIFNTGLTTTPNYTGLSVENRFVIGYIGELVFAEWAHLHNLRCDHTIVTNGKSQRPEITIYMGGEAVMGDIKAASAWHYRKAMLPVSQELDAEFYVAVKLDIGGRRGAVMGGAFKMDVIEFDTGKFGDHGIDTRFCDFEDLPVAVDEIKELFDHG